MLSRRIARRPWKWAATGIWPNRASRARWSRKSRSSWDVTTPHDSSAGSGEPESAGRILVVDDHEDNIELLRARLEAWGYRVDAARDGAEALRCVLASAP